MALLYLFIPLNLVWEILYTSYGGAASPKFGERMGSFGANIVAKMMGCLFKEEHLAIHLHVVAPLRLGQALMVLRRLTVGQASNTFFHFLEQCEHHARRRFSIELEF